MVVPVQAADGVQVLASLEWTVVLYLAGPGDGRIRDADALRCCIVVQECELVMPGRRNCKALIDHGRELYWEHNIVVSDFGYARQCHRLATRSEKTASGYPGL
ncbi:MAG: hypothetical protein OXC13_00420 [Caldilineaceae bacterium]|nr:hypothetical protein [Caldilineaceae bacterium]